MVDRGPQFRGQDLVGQFLLCSAPARFTHVPGQIGVRQDCGQSLRYVSHPRRLRVRLITALFVVAPRRHDQPGLAVLNGFPGPTGTDGHTRHPGGGRLDQHDAETFLF